MVVMALVASTGSGSSNRMVKGHGWFGWFLGQFNDE
jgi:hypothetical protein